MSLRIFSLGLCTLFAGCGGPPEGVGPADPSNVATIEAGTPPGEAVERVACATGGRPLAADCTVDRASGDGGTLLTIRHADGGFRRLLLASDGTIRAADGALPAKVTVAGGVSDVTIGDARYKIPSLRP